MSTIARGSEAAILDRVFRPELGGWPRPAAEALLEISFDQRDQQRMRELLLRAKAGEASADELKELENYRHIGRLLELMKARARNSIRVPAAE